MQIMLSELEADKHAVPLYRWTPRPLLSRLCVYKLSVFITEIAWRWTRRVGTCSEL